MPDEIGKPKNTNNRKVLEFLMQIGGEMLHNGAEIYRVQETMLMIAKFYHVETFHVYVIANGIFASIDENGEIHSTEIRHIPLAAIHLGRVVELNELSREISRGELTVEQATQRLEEVRQIPYTGKVGLILGNGLGAACFCYIFGGNFYDSLAALVSGILLSLFQMHLSKKKPSKIIMNILGSAFVTFLGVFDTRILTFLNLDKVIIGSIIPLVPGVPLTMSIRDYLNADYLSGTIRLIDALLVAFCIAAGVGLVLRLAQIVLGVAL